MTHHETKTGTRDVTYNLISIAYHALQGAENYAMYADDADQAGDMDSARFFREVMEEERKRADKAKELLRTRLSGEDKR